MEHATEQFPNACADGLPLRFTRGLYLSPTSIFLALLLTNIASVDFPLNRAFLYPFAETYWLVYLAVEFDRSRHVDQVILR